MGILVVGIQIDDLSVHVCLVVLDECCILLQCVVLAFSVLQQEVLFGLVVVVLLAQHAIVDEYLDVVPLLLEVLTLVLEDGGKLIAHLLGDVAADLLHVGITLEIASAYVQRNVGAVNHAVQ